MNSYEQRANFSKRSVGPTITDPYLNKFKSTSSTDPYGLLCLAVIKQAVKDTVSEKSEAYRFWTSEWYDMLTTNLPQFAGIGEKVRDQALANHRAGKRAGLASSDSDLYGIY